MESKLSQAKLRESLIEKFGKAIPLDDPCAVDELLGCIAAAQPSAVPSRDMATPFAVSWMDSWVAHWVIEQDVSRATERSAELGTALRALVDLKFDARMREIWDFVKRVRGRSEPPDGGSPEPGVPPDPTPAGPAPAIFAAPQPSPPDPPEPPDGGPPEPGVPPAPPTPPGPSGPDAVLRENPWILYWFVSIKAPMLLDVIDAHFTRRLDAIWEQASERR